MLSGKPSFRFGLFLSCCLSATLPVWGQSAPDPFAPNTLAPTEPTASLNAPKPIAPNVPPRLIETAPRTVEQTPVATKTAPPSAPVVVQTATPASNEGQSFWESLSSIFKSKEEATPDTKKEEAPSDSDKKVRVTQPIPTLPVQEEIQKENIITQETTPTYSPQATYSETRDPLATSNAAEQEALPTMSPVVEPGLIEKTLEPAQVQEPITHPNKVERITQSPAMPMPSAQTTQKKTPVPVKKAVVSQPSPSSDPFAPTTVAPKQPIDLPQEVQKPVLVENPVEPALMKTPVTLPNKAEVKKENVTLPQAPEYTESKDPLVHSAQKETQIKEEPSAIVQTPIAQEADPSFLDKLANLFSSNKPEKAVQEKAVAIEKPIADVVPTQQPPTPAPVMGQETPEPTFKVSGHANPEQPFAPQALSPTTPQPIEAVEPVKVPIITTETLKVETPEPVGARAHVSPIETPKTSSLAANTLPETTTQEPGFFERISNFFSSPFKQAEEPVAEEKRIVPEKTDPKDEPLETAAPEKTSTPVAVDPRLLKARFGLGNAIMLGQGDDDLSQKAKCFTKSRGTVAFCLTSTEWPSKIAAHFDISSHLYKGMQGIVQLDGNIATRLFSLFNSKGYLDLVGYYESKMGPATHHFVRKVRSLKEGMVDSNVYIWRKENKQDGLIEIFEIRQIAEIHGSLPNLEQGSVRAYFEGSREIFRRASNLDFMDLR